MLQLLRILSTFRFMDCPECFVDVRGVLLNAHRLQLAHSLRLGYALERVCQSDQILERTHEELGVLSVLRAHAIEVFFNLCLQGCLVEA